MKSVNAASIILLHNGAMPPDAIINIARGVNWTEHAIDRNWHRPYGKLHSYAEFERRHAGSYGLSDYGKRKARFLVGTLALLCDAELPMTRDAVTWQVHEELGIAAVNGQWFDDLRFDRLLRERGGEYTLTAHGQAVADRVIQWFPEIVARLRLSAKVAIKAYGIRWRRNLVEWKGDSTRLYGQTPDGREREEIDYNGVYVLYQNVAGAPVYVGQTGRRLVARLDEHTRNDKADRWDEFSWFGIEHADADDSGAQFNQYDVINALEAILIAVNTPPGNNVAGVNLGARLDQYTGDALI